MKLFIMLNPLSLLVWVGYLSLRQREPGVGAQEKAGVPVVNHPNSGQDHNLSLFNWCFNSRSPSPMKAVDEVNPLPCSQFLLS
jgi:hypothetical protein